MLDRLIYRFKQFYSGAFAKYDNVDRSFVCAYLNTQESSVFNQLPDFEKKHSVRVARRMLQLALYNPELDQHKLVRLGLLHDIGKVYERNSVITKSILVIIRYLFPGLYDWLANRGEKKSVFRKFYIHKHHGAVGAQLLAKIGVGGEILSMIAKHDPRIEPFGPEDPVELKILQQADSSY